MGRKKSVTELEKLEEIFNESIRQTAELTLVKTQNLYKTVIQMFYDDYQPLWYNRTLATREASSGFGELFTPENFQVDGNVFTTRINIDPSYIKTPNPYRADTAWVFNRTFVKGIHGINVRPNVFGRNISKTFQRINKRPSRKEYKDGALSAVYYRDAFKISMSTMKNMVPAPRAWMNKEFKEMTKKGNMKKRFERILKRNLS